MSEDLVELQSAARQAAKSGRSAFAAPRILPLRHSVVGAAG
jgi:hypothetical protein